MTTELIELIGSFFYMVLIAFSIQNAVFGRSLGVSRLISLVDDTTDTAVFGVLLTIVTMVNAAASWGVQKWLLSGYAYADYVRPLSMVLCTVCIFVLILLFSRIFMQTPALRKVVRALPYASFNCLVIGTALLCVNEELTILESLGFALGSSLGFIAAVVIVTEAQRKLSNRSIPSAFKGLPATLLFLAALSLAIYGLTGFTLKF